MHRIAWVGLIGLLLIVMIPQQPAAAAAVHQQPYPLPATATATSTPTATPSPTATATSTPEPTDEPPPPTPWVVTATPPAATATPTMAAPLPDAYEPNNAAGQAAPITLGSVDKLSFWPLGDSDWFALTIKPSQAGLTLTVDTFITAGLDTQLQLFGPDGSLVAQNDDVSATDVRASLATRVISPGTYLISVANVAQARPDFKTYQLVTALVEQPPAPAAPSAPATPAERGADQYAGNYQWDFAPAIPVGERLAELTFGCPAFDYLDLATCVVPDFFRIQVKGGQCYAVRTEDLAAGVDTNVIVYGPERDQAAPWGGSDDVAAGDFRSAVTFCVPPEAGVRDAYLLIGQVGNRPPPAPIGERTYSLLVTALVTATATPTPLPSPTPAPPAAPPAGGTTGGAPSTGSGGSGSGNGGMGTDGGPGASAPPAVPAAPANGDGRVIPAPTERANAGPLPGLVVEEIPLAEAEQPTSVPQRVVPLSLAACYDRNQNQACDIDEGIAGLAVYVTDGRSGAVLGQALTDPSGQAALTVRVEDTAELIVSVPSFAATQRITAQSPRTRPVMVKTVTPLPALLP